jgi:type II secretory pathway component PulJ
MKLPNRRGAMSKVSLRNDRGVCLAEFMVSLTAGAIVLAASLQTFTMLHAQTIQQQRRLAQQQEMRVGLEVFEQEVRLAATDSIVTATDRELRFLANINDQRTTLSNAIVPGQLVVPVLDGSGWAKGKSVRMCSGQICESHKLLRDGQRLQLTLTEPVGAAFPAGASMEVINQVRYYTRLDDQQVVSLMRMVDGGANVLVGGLGDVRLSYWDEEGRPTVTAAIKRVVIEMTSRSWPKKSVREVSLRS